MPISTEPTSPTNPSGGNEGTQNTTSAMAIRLNGAASRALADDTGLAIAIADAVFRELQEIVDDQLAEPKPDPIYERALPFLSNARSSLAATADAYENFRRGGQEGGSGEPDPDPSATRGGQEWRRR